MIVVAYLNGLLQGHKNERNQPITQPAEGFAEEYYQKQKHFFDHLIIDVDASFLNQGQ